MAFCPDCKAEYRPGISRCPDREVDLVVKLTPETIVHDKSDHKFVPFRSFNNSAEAEMAFELFERNGIRSFVKGGEVGIFGSSFLGGAVMVDERDLTRAVELYEAYFESEPAPSEEDQEDN